MKILTWNVDGFRKSIISGFNFVIKNLDPDIICLNETKIKTETLLLLFTDTDYEIFHNPFNPANHHGVATFIKKDLYKIYNVTEIPVKINMSARNDLKVKVKVKTNIIDISEDLQFQKGRIQYFEFKSNDDKISSFKLVNTYFPNSGINGLDKLPYRIDVWDKG